MTDELLRKESLRFGQALPVYLGMQGITLLFTYLDFQVYMESYLAQHTLTVTAWLGAWFILLILGLSACLILVAGKGWRTVLDERLRIKMAGGYLLGAIAGLLALGIRFMPLMPPAYFAVIGGLALFLAAGYLVWNKRQPSSDEMFP